MGKEITLQEPESVTMEQLMERNPHFRHEGERETALRSKLIAIWADGHLTTEEYQDLWAAV
jgi:hypothetical protein